jgi:hypothetical protein
MYLYIYIYEREKSTLEQWWDGNNDDNGNEHSRLTSSSGTEQFYACKERDTA